MSEHTLDREIKIAVAGTGYVGLSLAVLLAQNHSVTAVDIDPAKVAKLQNYESPIRDESSTCRASSLIFSPRRRPAPEP